MSNEISDEHIRVAAYYIWVAEGFPEGMAEAHWERARTALGLPVAKSVTPDSTPVVQEEAAVTTEAAPVPTMEPITELTAEPALARPAATRKTVKPVT